MLILTKDESAYIRQMAPSLPISRIAFKLNRDYDDVELHMVQLGLRTQKQFEERLLSKYAAQDEIEYQMLQNGSSEQMIKDEHQRARVFPSHASVSSYDDSND